MRKIHTLPLQHHDFSNLPDTLLVTMEYDPLRDEGEALGEKMREAGCSVKSVRVLDGIHGMMLLPPIFTGAKKFMRQLKASLENEDNRKTSSQNRCFDRKRSAF